MPRLGVAAEYGVAMTDHSEEPVRTGDPAVDDVLDSLDGLDDADVSAHVAVFERAHEHLRAALDGSRA